jgi:hypothetical protein
METAGDIINGSLRLLGVLAEGEVPSAETSQDALRAMNQMIDSWNTERLAVFSTQDQVFTWPAGFISRTLGPSGDFVGNRPVLLEDSTYFVKTPALASATASNSLTSSSITASRSRPSRLPTRRLSSST